MQPLEQTAPELFQAAEATYLEPEQAIEGIHQHPGIIPVAITPSQKVVWLDVGDYQFKEWKFRYSIKNLIDNRGLGKCFTTDIQLLMEDDVLTSNLTPTGFVFHMSKCGSTLMAKALAQPSSHMAVSEGTPLHENLWQYLTNGWQEPVTLTDNRLALIRNLILAMGRRRLSEQRCYFVKFRSWNVTFLEAIQRAFPGTPCLFMYRHPAEVLVSSLNKPTTGQYRLKESGAAAFITGHSAEALRDMSDLDYFTSLYEQHMRFGLTQAQGRMMYLNYRQMTKANLASILQQAFGYTTTEASLQLMQAQFDSYAKDDSGTTRFSPDSQEKQKQVTPEIRGVTDRYLMAWYQQLEQSPGNLNRLLA